MLKFKQIQYEKLKKVQVVTIKLSIIKYYYIRFKRYKNTCNYVKKITLLKMNLIRRNLIALKIKFK